MPRLFLSTHKCSCIMVYHIISKPLLLVFVIVQALLNGPSWAKEVEGIKGTGINISFSFQNSSKAYVESVGLYKDGMKICECNGNHVESVGLYKDGTKTCECSGNHVHNCSSEKATCVFDTATTEAFVCLRNLTSADNGTYWATLFSSSRKPPFVRSNEVTVILQSDSIDPGSSLLTNYTKDDDNGGPEKPLQGTYPLLWAVVGLVVPSIALLGGLLIWFCWTDKRNPERDKQEDLSTKPQESGVGSTSGPVYSVEYGVLSFNTRPGEGDWTQHGRVGNIVRPSEGVEYAAVSFPQRQRKENGR